MSKTSLILAMCLLSATVFADRETIRVVYCDRPGYSFVDQDGERHGYAVDLIQRLAMILNWDLQWIKVGDGQVGAALHDGKADLSALIESASTTCANCIRTRLPIGFSQQSLLAANDSIFGAKDYSRLDGVIVGVQSDNPIRSRVAEILARNNIRSRIVEYASERDLIAALNAGKIGAAVAEATEVYPQVRTVMKLPPEAMYLSVSVTRPELVRSIDEAIGLIYSVDPTYASTLRRRYFHGDSDFRTAFTFPEIVWIDRQRRMNRAFTIDFSPTDGAIKRFDPETGWAGGLLGEIFAEVSIKSDLLYRTLPPGDLDRAIAEFNAGKIDILIPYGCERSQEEKISAAAKVIQVEMPQAAVIRHFSAAYLAKEGVSLAVPRQDEARIRTYEQLGMSDRVQICDSLSAAIAAVAAGKADCCVGDYLSIRAKVQESADRAALDVRLLDNPLHSPKIKIYVGAHADAELASVLSKICASFDRKHMVMLSDSAEAKAYDPRMVDIGMLLPYLLTTVILVLAVIVGILWYFGRKTRKLLHRSESSLLIAQEAIDDAAVARTEMRKALSAAEKAAQSKSSFLATMSHEIRTPLNAVIGFSEFLSAPGVTADKVAEYAHGISLSANALLSLINDILDLSKFESGKAEGLDIRTGECDLGRLLEEMDSVFRMRVENKGLTLTLSAATVIPPLKLSEPRLRQILLNLIGNAVKFTDRGGISVSARYDDGTVTIKVADTGIGITSNGLEHIFDPFSQDLESRGGKVNAGTGLGLSIVKRIVEASHGKVSVESTIGKGSVFTIVIPQVAALERQPAPVAPAVASSAAPVARRVFRHVIIVDDVAMNRKVLKMHCLSQGIAEPIVFESGLEVVDYLKQPENPCDLVLSDVWMPGMDGSELSRQCAALRPDLPVVAVTADTDAGASFDVSLFKGVLTKPISADKLAELLAKLA